MLTGEQMKEALRTERPVTATLVDGTILSNGTVVGVLYQKGKTGGIEVTLIVRSGNTQYYCHGRQVAFAEEREEDEPCDDYIWERWRWGL